MKNLRIAVLMLAIFGGGASVVRAATVNEKGSAGVCVAVTTGAVVTVMDGSSTRTTSTIYATQDMNCMPGNSANGAPAIAPTTGAIGTGKGFPFGASQYITLAGARSIDLGGATGAPINLDPGNRLDCIARTTNGNVCTWGQF